MWKIWMWKYFEKIRKKKKIEKNQENINLTKLIENYDSRLETLLLIDNIVRRRVVWYCQKCQYNRKRKAKDQLSIRLLIAFLISSDLSSSIESPGWYSNFRFRALRALWTAPDPSANTSHVLAISSRITKRRHWLRTPLNTSLADVFLGYFRPIFSRFPVEDIGAL